MGNIFQKTIQEKKELRAKLFKKKGKKTCFPQKRYQKKITIAQNKKLRKTKTRENKQENDMNFWYWQGIYHNIEKQNM